MKKLYSEPNFSCGDYEFTHQEILNLQALFLTNGFHFITFKNSILGRSLMTTLLDSMPTLQDIAVLTQEETLPGRFVNIYTTLMDNQIYTEEAMADFFINNFYFDALWIEALPGLCATQWFADLEHSMVSLNIDKNIPIIVTQP